MTTKTNKYMITVENSSGDVHNVYIFSPPKQEFVFRKRDNQLWWNRDTLQVFCNYALFLWNAGSCGPVIKGLELDTLLSQWNDNRVLDRMKFSKQKVSALRRLQWESRGVLCLWPNFCKKENFSVPGSKCKSSRQLCIINCLRGLVPLTTNDPLREIREAMREGNTIVVADTHEYQASITLGHNPEKKLLALQ